jgi:hypothetical protein
MVNLKISRFFAGNLGARTGLYACIFFASGKKGYRSNPLRCFKTASLPF